MSSEPDDEPLDRCLRRLEAVLRRVIRDELAEVKVNVRFLSVRRASIVYGIGTRKLHAFITDGRLPAFAPPGTRDRTRIGKMLVDVGDLERLIRSHRVVPLDAIVDDVVDEVLASMK